MKNQDELTVSISETLAQASELRTINSETDWIIPIPTADNITIEVTYQW